MKIKHIHIDGFGCYSNKSFPTLDEPLTIFFGPNEAGKTTFLAFIRMVLFGFPERHSAEHFPPLAGGNHGGRLQVETDAGEVFTVERRPGSKGGIVTITAADGTAVAAAPAFLSNLLGHVTRSTFESVFAFDLDDLQELEDDISPTSVGAVRLPSVLKKLKKDADELYKPGGSKQKVAEVLVELQSVKNKVEEVRSQAGDYQSAVSETNKLTRNIQALEEELSTVRARAEELRRRRDAWPDWNAFKAVEESLEKIPVRPDFPVDPIVRLEGFEKQSADADEGVDRIRGELERVRKTAECSIAGEGLLGDSAAVEEIGRRRGSFDNSVRDLPRTKRS